MMIEQCVHGCEAGNWCAICETVIGFRVSADVDPPGPSRARKASPPQQQGQGFGYQVMAQRTGEGWRVLLELAGEPDGKVRALLDPDRADKLAQQLREYAKVCRGQHVSQADAAT